MDLKAIIQLMNSALEFDLTVEDFNNPMPARVQLICQAFIMHVFEVPEATMSHLPLDALSPDDDSEVLQRAAPLIILYATMNQFVQDMTTEYPFGMCDLISPEPRRFRRLMSLLASYLKFHATMMPHWQNTADSFQQDREYLIEVQREINEANATKEVLVSKAKIRLEKEKELAAVLNKKQEEILRLHRLVTDLEFEVQKNKAEVTEQKRLQDELLMEQESLVIQIEQLSLQILGSPERVLSDVNSLKEQLQKSREQCDKQRKINEETKNQIEIASSVSGLITVMGQQVEGKILKEKANLDLQLATRVEAQEKLREAELLLAKKAEIEWNEVEENYKKEEVMHSERMKELVLQKGYTEREIEECKKDPTSPSLEMGLQRQVTTNLFKIKEFINDFNSDVSKAGEAYKETMKLLNGEAKSAYELFENMNSILTQTRKVLAEKSISNIFNETTDETTFTL